jgi:hypothetical protein
VYDSTIEKWSRECNLLFDLSDVLLYTSESVSEELKRVSKRRKDFYGKMVSFYQQKGDLYLFSLDEMNPNDRSSFERLIHQLRKMKGKDVLLYLRQLIFAVEEGIEVLLDRIQKPLIPRYKDPYREDLIFAIIQNRQDSYVICDFIAWALTSDKAYFTTLDDTDILQNKLALIEHIQNYWDARTDNLDFVHVETIVRNFQSS